MIAHLLLQFSSFKFILVFLVLTNHLACCCYDGSNVQMMFNTFQDDKCFWEHAQSFWGDMPRIVQSESDVQFAENVSILEMQWGCVWTFCLVLFSILSPQNLGTKI